MSDWTRRGILGAFAATALCATPYYANAAGYVRQNAGDIRRLQMANHRTGERIDMIYWIDGEYIADAIHEINHHMRDWRNDQVKAIDLRTIDIIAASHRLLETNEPFTLISGYRSPATNAMLRARSSGVAKNSLHLRAQAADLRLGSRSVAQIYRAGQTCGGGGVGRYSKSNFVHLDCGPVRQWGR